MKIATSQDNDRATEHAIQVLAQFISHARGGEVPSQISIDEADKAIEHLQ